MSSPSLEERRRRRELETQKELEELERRRKEREEKRRLEKEEFERRERELQEKRRGRLGQLSTSDGKTNSSTSGGVTTANLSTSAPGASLNGSSSSSAEEERKKREEEERKKKEEDERKKREEEERKKKAEEERKQKEADEKKQKDEEEEKQHAKELERISRYTKAPTTTLGAASDGRAGSRGSATRGKSNMDSELERLRAERERLAKEREARKKQAEEEALALKKKLEAIKEQKEREQEEKLRKERERQQQLEEELRKERERLEKIEQEKQKELEKEREKERERLERERVKQERIDREKERERERERREQERKERERKEREKFEAEKKAREERERERKEKEKKEREEREAERERKLQADRERREKEKQEREQREKEEKDKEEQARLKRIAERKAREEQEQEERERLKEIERKQREEKDRKAQEERNARMEAENRRKKQEEEQKEIERLRAEVQLLKKKELKEKRKREREEEAARIRREEEERKRKKQEEEDKKNILEVEEDEEIKKLREELERLQREEEEEKKREEERVAAAAVAVDERKTSNRRKTQAMRAPSQDKLGKPAPTGATTDKRSQSVRSRKLTKPTDEEDLMSMINENLRNVSSGRARKPDSHGKSSSPQSTALTAHASAKEKAATSREKKNPVLIQLKGEKRVHVRKVELSSASLNYSDVYLLDAGDKIYQWNGPKAHRNKRAKGVDVANAINKNQRGGGADVIIIEAIMGQDDNCPPEFWSILGGKPESIPESRGNDVQMEKHWNENDKLFRVNPGGVLFKVDGAVTRAKLASNFVYILDCTTEVYVWCGKDTDTSKREEAVKVAKRHFLKTERPSWSILRKINEDHEPVLFIEKFVKWEISKKKIGKAAALAASGDKKPKHSDSPSKKNLDSVEEILKLYDKKYTYEQLLRGEYPASLDSAKKESYLSDEEFQVVFGMPKEAFYKQSAWKIANMKRKAYLF